MGGEGSGRKPDPMKQIFPKATPIGDFGGKQEIVLPNYSGVINDPKVRTKISALEASLLNYMPLSGGTFTGNVTMTEGVKLYWGSLQGVDMSTNGTVLSITRNSDIGGPSSFVLREYTGLGGTVDRFSVGLTNGITTANTLNLTGNSAQITFDSDAAFSVSTILQDSASGSTKTCTLPNSTTTLAGLATTQTWTGTNTFDQVAITDAKNIAVGTGTGTKIGTSASQKLGFFNATPIVQQTTTSQTPATFTANTSGIVDDSATWDGYTLGDVVKILRAFGFLA